MSLNSALNSVHYVVGQVCKYYNQRVAVCRLQDSDWQRYTDKFKSSGIDKCPYRITRTEWTDNSSVSKVASTTRPQKVIN